MGGGQFSQGMPGKDVRPQAPAFGQPEQRHVQREQGGLGVRGVREQLAVRRPGVGEHHRLQRPLGCRPRTGAGQQGAPVRQQMGVEGRARLVEGRREGREGGVQTAPHTGALAALPGEQEGHGSPAAGRHRIPHGVRRRVTLGHRVEPAKQRAPVGADHGGPVLEGRARGGQRQRHVGGGQARVRPDEVREPPRLVP